MKRYVLAVVLVGVLALVLTGCARFGTPPEVAQTEEKLEEARMAGADQDCPKEFNEAWTAWQKAERLCPCEKQEARAQAEVAMAKAEALCTDSDGDGVPDERDECPDTPAGVEVDRFGCPLDSDGDGVPDSIDQCPDTPAGVEVDEVGCPLDSDGDGVPDYLDECPGTPMDVVVDETGCPVEIRKQLHVRFDFNQATIKPDDYPVLEQMAAFLQEHPEATLVVEGHTDSTGPDDYNMKLSEQRAESVKSYLVENYYIEPERIETVGYGETRPIADNSTKEGRRENRRAMGVISEYEEK